MRILNNLLRGSFSCHPTLLGKKRCVTRQKGLRGRINFELPLLVSIIYGYEKALVFISDLFRIQKRKTHLGRTF